LLLRESIREPERVEVAREGGDDVWRRSVTAFVCLMN
jgi:hypothetical protein